MEFLYKLRYKNSGNFVLIDKALSLWPDNSILMDEGKIFTVNPQNINLNITVHTGKPYEPDSFETKTKDWIIEEFVYVLHECHIPVEEKRDFGIDVAAICQLYGRGYLSNPQKLFADMMGFPIREKSILQVNPAIVINTA